MRSAASQFFFCTLGATEYPIVVPSTSAYAASCSHRRKTLRSSLESFLFSHALGEVIAEHRHREIPDGGANRCQVANNAPCPCVSRWTERQRLSHFNIAGFIAQETRCPWTFVMVSDARFLPTSTSVRH